VVLSEDREVFTEDRGELTGDWPLRGGSGGGDDGVDGGGVGKEGTPFSR